MTDIMEVARLKGSSTYKHKTGFYENWSASLGQTIDEGLSVSRFIHDGVVRDTRADILKLIRNGDIPEHVTQYEPDEAVNGGINYDKVALWANDNIGTQFSTTQELRDNVREELKVRRDYAESVHKDADYFGVAGDFLGSLHGFALDPINDATMFLGAGMASRSVLSLAGREAAIAGVSEAAIQPFVLSWKKDIGADYSAKDAVANIVMATGMGGTIGALTAGIGKLLRKKPVTKEEKTAYQAAEYLQNELKEAPDLKMDAGEYLGNIEKAVQQINDAKPEFLPQAEVKAGITAKEIPTGDEIISILDEISPGTGVIKQKITEAEKLGKGFVDEAQMKLVGTNPEWYTRKGFSYKGVQSLTEKLKEGKTNFNKMEQSIYDAVNDYTGQATEKAKIQAQADIDIKAKSKVAKVSTTEEIAGFDDFMGDEVDLRFDTLSKENPDAPTIISHEKDMKGDTIINYGRAADEVKKIEAQELDLESIRGCLIGG